MGKSHLEQLVTKGMFPKELPPWFTTSEFAKIYAQKSKRDLLTPKAKDYKCVASDHALFTINRPGLLKRTVHVPNPITHGLLAQAITGNWNHLFKLGRRTKSSLSAPKYSKTGARYIVPRVKISNKPYKLSHLRSHKTYLVRCDVKEFYSSIYTHALAWSVSPRAKKEWRNERLLGNKLDKLVRLGQKSRSNGVPIGPDTSFILAELLLVKVDQIVQGKVEFLRWYDDYEMVFSSYEEAERGLSVLESALSEYHLTINPLKTEIIRLPHAVEREWARVIGGYYLDANVKNLQRYFDIAFQYSKDEPESNVLQYAIARLFVIKLDDRALSLVLSNLTQCVLSERGCAPKACSLIMHWKANGLDVSSFDSKVLVDKLVDRAILTNELQDLSWVLCLVIATKQVLGKEIAKKLQKITNPILGVQVMHANSLGLLPGYTLRYWEKKIQLDELYGKDWIAIYEGVYHGWLQDPKGVVGNDKYFGKLLSEKVFFYDVEQPEYKIIFHPQGMPAWIQEKVKALVDTYSSGEKIEGFSILIPQSGSSELETRLGKLEIKVEELGEIISDIQANKISFEEASELFIEGEDIY